MYILSIFLTGILILIAAIILNAIANLIGVFTWYSYIELIRGVGFFEASKKASFSLIFLYVIYPFLLGLVAKYSLKFLENFNYF